MIPIKSVHAPGVSYRVAGDAGLGYVKDASEQGKFKIPMTLNTTGIDCFDTQSLLFDPDSYYYGVMPVIANAVSAMGGNALAVAKASIMGQMTLGFPLSPLTGATFLLLGLSGQDLGDHQKHTLPYAWVASAIMVAVGCVACGLLF